MLVKPAVPEKLPGLQALHFVEPVLSLVEDPIAQSVHAAEPFTELNCPEKWYMYNQYNYVMTDQRLKLKL